MKRAILPLIVGVAMCGTAASAATNITAVNATPVYSGPAPVFDFDTPGTTPTFLGGGVVGDVPGQHVQPTGSLGSFYSVGPSTSEPGVVDLGISGLAWISFLWGSVDTYNTLQLLDAGNNILDTITGSQIQAGANGQTTSLVTLNLTGPQSQVAKLWLNSSGTNAFEIDNIAFQAVPEPATWMMLILGMLGVGFAMRRRTSEPSVRVRYV
jgi:hypothetical protein